MDSWRTSALADRHRALGSDLEDWNGMGTAWSYSGDIAEEFIAIRTRAGLMDVSGLKKVHVVGPHAAHVLDLATTREVNRLMPGQSVYAAMLNEGGKFTEDCIVFRTGATTWMVVHGSGTGHEELQRAALGKNVAIAFDDDLHDLSIQGPAAVDFLDRFVPRIRDLPYFHHTGTRLFDAPVLISRTGYTGERGYEIFCRSQDAPTIWDTILRDGADFGIIPCRFTVLDMLRVESYLLFYPYDNSQMYPFENEPPGDSLWELGLQFTVTPGKTGFRGAEEHARLEGRERFKIYGVLVDGTVPTDAGDELWSDDRKVGIITCGMYSPLTERSMAIARLSVDVALHGTPLEVRGASVAGSATAHTLPFDDLKKTKRTAIG